MKKKVITILSIYKKYLKYNIGFIIFSILLIVVSYISPLINAAIIDKGIQKSNKRIIIICLLLLIIVSTMNSIINYFMSKLKIKYLYIIEKNLKNKIIKHFFKGSNDEKIDNESEFDTLIRSDVGKFIGFVSDTLHNVAIAAIKIIVLVALLFKIQLILGVGILVFQLIFIVINKLFNDKIEKISYEMRENYVNSIQKVNEIIRHVKEIRLLNGTNYMMRQYNKALDNNYKSTTKSNKYIQLSIFFSSVFEVVLQSFIIGVGGLLIIDGRLSIGLLVSFMSYSGMLREELGEIISVWTEYCEEKVSLDIVFNVLEKIKKSDNEKTLNESVKDVSKIILKNISFSYEDNQDIFSKTSIVFDNKQINYVVGRSGIGKSTLIKLMLGYLMVDKGSIEYGSENIYTLLKNNTIIEYVSWVPQEPIIFCDTIRNNIVLDGSVDEKELIDVCKKCMIYDDIIKMENGFDTVLGDDGNKISVGQKHRLGLVRALLQKKKILLIDEGTAGLDSVTEEHIRENLESLCGKSLTVIVTHSPNFIVNKSKVYKIENKKITEMNNFNV